MFMKELLNFFRPSPPSPLEFRPKNNIIYYYKNDIQKNLDLGLTPSPLFQQQKSDNFGRILTKNGL